MGSSRSGLESDGPLHVAENRTFAIWTGTCGLYLRTTSVRWQNAPHSDVMREYVPASPVAMVSDSPRTNLESLLLISMDAEVWGCRIVRDSRRGRRSYFIRVVPRYLQSRSRQTDQRCPVVQSTRPLSDGCPEVSHRSIVLMISTSVRDAIPMRELDRRYDEEHRCDTRAEHRQHAIAHQDRHD